MNGQKFRRARQKSNWWWKGANNSNASCAEKDYDTICLSAVLLLPGTHVEWITSARPDWGNPVDYNPASLRCADVQLMVSTCSLGVKTLRIFRCSSSWQFPGICCRTTSAYGRSSLVDLNQPLREVFQIRTFQTDNPNAHSQRLLHGCGLWLPHHLICCWEWAGALQQAGVCCWKSVKAYQRNIWFLIDGALSVDAQRHVAQREHLHQMEADSRDDQRLALALLSDYRFSCFSTWMFFPSHFLKRLLPNCFCPEVSSPCRRPRDLAKQSPGTVAAHICKRCAHLFAFSMSAHLIASVSLQGDLHVSQMKNTSFNQFSLPMEERVLFCQERQREMEEEALLFRLKTCHGGIETGPLGIRGN